MGESVAVADNMQKLTSSRVTTFANVVTIVLFVWFVLICFGAIRLLASHGQGVQYCVKPQAECVPGSDGKIGAGCLYECPSPENIDELLKALSSSNGLTRRGALATLTISNGGFAAQNEKLVTVLSGLLADSDPYTRIKAAQVLKSIGTPPAIEAVKTFVVSRQRPSAGGRTTPESPNTR